MKKYLEKCDSERVQFHSNTAPGNENKRRASLKKDKINVFRKSQVMDLQHLAMKTKVLGSKKEQQVPKTLSCRQNIASKIA